MCCCACRCKSEQKVEIRVGGVVDNADDLAAALKAAMGRGGAR